jgi:myo-inositol 2-dehydrogenase/D-chiro-inositol 1-dehydrogenase
MMLRFGLFGAGRIGRVHAASLAAHPQAELAVVHDPVEAAALEVATQYGAAPTQDAEVRCGRARRCCARSRSTWT